MQDGYGHQVRHAGLSHGLLYSSSFSPTIQTTYTLMMGHADSTPVHVVCAVCLYASKTCMLGCQKEKADSVPAHAVHTD